MGEIFVKERVNAKLSHTGERFTTGHGIETEIEHYHRYFFARSHCRGKDVLDIASGEGYGSALLAQVATSVVGVDLSAESIAHAQATHSRANLKYLVGDVRQIPLADHSVDVIVSFETLEHFYEHDLFMREVKRVLRPDGCFIMSTPDSDIYSAIGIPANPYHVNELTKAQLTALCKKYFKKMYLLHQRNVVGSVLVGQSDTMTSPITFESRGEGYIERSEGLSRAPYLVCLVSDVDYAVTNNSVFIHEDINAWLKTQSQNFSQELESKNKYQQHLEHEIRNKEQQIHLLQQKFVNQEQQLQLLNCTLAEKEQKIKNRFPQSLLTWIYAKILMSSSKKKRAICIEQN